MADSATIKQEGPNPSPEPVKTQGRKIRARRGEAPPSPPAPPPEPAPVSDSPIGNQSTPAEAAPAQPPSLALSAPSQRDRAVQRLGLPRAPMRVDLTRALTPGGGFKKIMAEIVPMVAAVDARYDRLIALWETCSETDRKSLFPEDFLQAADIRPADFIGEVARMAFEVNMSVGIFQQAVAHQDIMKTHLGEAKKAKGLQDRLAHLKAVGVMPLPKSATTHVMIQNNANGQGGEGAKELPSFERDMLATQKVLQAEDADFEEVSDAP